MNSTLKALYSIQTEIELHAASSSRPPAVPSAHKRSIKLVNDHVYEICTPVGRPSVEFVFFHGLQPQGSDEAHLTTWMSGDGSELWLDWLLKPFPEARILLVSYDASTRKTDKAGRMDKYVTCENLLSCLTDREAQVGQDGCPVVLVGHCLGGLIMKQLCLHATYKLALNPHDKPDEAIQNLLHNIKGLFFYSTPHQGSRVADVSKYSSKGPLFEILTTLNTETARCNEEFRKLRAKHGWRAEGVGESCAVTLGEFKGFVVVEEASSRHDVDSYYTITRADRFNVCRPDSMRSNSYSLLSNFVTGLLKDDRRQDGFKIRLHDKHVGLEGQVKRFKHLLRKVHRLGIVGMGGIGKTTLAQSLYNTISQNFEYTCFLREVKTQVSKRVIPEDLRAKIIESLYCRDRKVSGNFTWSQLKKKRVLIVLDDPESEFQVDVMTPSDGFAVDSRVIVTSRDARYLIAKDFECHSAHQLGDEDSKRLFCLYAFNSADPPSGYEEHVLRFVKKCQGLPLALEVAGRHLYKQPIGMWDDVLDTLNRAEPLDGRKDDGLWSILRTSYESLAYAEQEMFLDIAVCFHGELLEEVKDAWRVQWRSADNKWQNLVDKNLVKAETKRIQMHEVLRDLGRSMACPDPESVVGHSRVLLDRVPDWLVDQAKSKVRVLKLYRHLTERGDGSKRPQTSRTPKFDIDIESLQGLDELRVLWLTNVGIRGPCHLLPPNLVFLRFTQGAWRTGSNFSIQNTSQQQSRQRLTLRHLEIKSFEDISDVVNTLEHFQALEHLDLSEHILSGRTALPETLGELSGLKYLRISIPNLRALPTTFGELQGLRVLKLDCMSLEALPDAVGNLQALEWLKIVSCEIQHLPDDICKLQKLRKLQIRACRKLRILPDAIGTLQSLECFQIVGCGIQCLPNDIRNLQALRTLRISHCETLKSLPYSLMDLHGLESLEVIQCHNIEPNIPTVGDFRYFVRTTSLASWRVIFQHRKALEKVSLSDYEGALAHLNSCNFEELEPVYQGFFLQERGILKRFLRDLGGALQDLTAAINIFSEGDHVCEYAYDSWKHRGFAKFLSGDLDGAKEDGEMAQTLLASGRFGNLMSGSLGDAAVQYLQFSIPVFKKFKGVLHVGVRGHLVAMVRASNGPSTMAVWKAFDFLMPSGGFHRGFYLQERGVWKRMNGDLHGALEDLTAALEIKPDDYEYCKHRGYVKFLLGDIDGARIDARRCLAMGLKEPRDYCLGTSAVAYLDFNL